MPEPKCAKPARTVFSVELLILAVGLVVGHASGLALGISAKLVTSQRMAGQTTLEKSALFSARSCAASQ